MRVALGIVIGLVLPSCATAAEVSYSAADASVSVAAAPGEANALTVGLSGRTVTVHDDGAALTAGSGCTGSGDVTCNVPVCPLGGTGGCPALEIDTGDGTDRLALSARSAVATDVHLGDGDDGLTLDSGDHVSVFGEAGADQLMLRGEGVFAELGAGDDRLEATGPGQVEARGDAGDDELLGGDGDDQLVGGAGADHVDGRGGTDLALYDASQTTGVSVTLNGMADDGAAGERDAVAAEGIGGTAGHDVLVGDEGANLILGYGGDDDVRCLGGQDLVVVTPVSVAPPDCEIVATGADPAAIQPRAKQALTVKKGRVKVRFTVREGYAHKKLRGRVELFAADGTRIGKAPVRAKGGTRSVSVAVPGALPGPIRIDGTAVRGEPVSVVREPATLTL